MPIDLLLVRPPGDFAAVVLDVDGTMYRQRSLRAAMLLRLARASVRRPHDAARLLAVLRAYRRAQEHLRTSADHDARSQLGVAADACGHPEADVRVLVERWMEAEPLPLLPRAARPGLRAFLERARTAGLRRGVFSDYPAEAKLAALGVRDLFDVVLSAQDGRVGRFKPDPSGLLAVADALHVTPGRAVYVGDRPDVDGEAARRAGMRCVIITKRATPGADWSAVSGFPALGELLFAT